MRKSNTLREFLCKYNIDISNKRIILFGTGRFIKGWFEDTMPVFNERIIAAYIDVDLASSTKTCLKYLYPLLVPGGDYLLT